MLKVDGNGLLIVVSGPSGAGKDTICNRVIEDSDNIWLSVSMTSRNPRGNEKEGKNYFFMVGSAHYAGDKGVDDLLADMGYTVVSIHRAFCP